MQTDLIRIELDVRRCAYYTQLDAVQVEGYEPISEEVEDCPKKHSRYKIISRKELEWYLSLIEEKNSEKRQICNSSPGEEVDDYPAKLLPLPQSSMDFDFIQSSTICPISLAICKFPSSVSSSALMNQTPVTLSEKPFVNSCNSIVRFPVGITFCYYFSYVLFLLGVISNYSTKSCSGYLVIWIFQLFFASLLFVGKQS